MDTLKSTKVPGWNEIDAVGLLDRNEKCQWAESAEASSSFADLYSTEVCEDPAVTVLKQRVAVLEQQARQTRAELEALRTKVEQMQKR